MSNLAPYTNVSFEPVPSDAARAIYTSADNVEDVTLMHVGDALDDVLWGVTNGALTSGAPQLPRLVPVRFRLAPRSTIKILATGATSARNVLVIATPLPEEASVEEELFNIRCLMTQLVAIMGTVAQRMEVK